MFNSVGSSGAARSGLGGTASKLQSRILAILQTVAFLKEPSVRRRHVAGVLRSV
jgi:hypothetical protein